jgi:hypothetical protein
MKTNEPLIPLAGVRLTPGGAVRALLWVGAASVAVAVALLGYGLVAGELDRMLQRAAVSAFVACYAIGVAIYARRSDRRPRVPAPFVFAHVRKRPPLPVRAIAALFVAVVLGVWFASGWEAALRLGVSGAGILCGMWFFAVLYRRQMHRQATTIFTLYADGLLDAAATAAIDDARRKDPVFDAAVREHQRLCAEVARVLQ